MRKSGHRRSGPVGLLHAHLVFVVKYHRRVITKTVFQLLRRSFTRTARLPGLRIEAVEADGDHVHVLVGYPPALPVSRMVQRLEGASSHFVRKARLPDVISRLFGPAFWSPNCFFSSAGGAPVDAVRAYVENQQAPDRRKRRPANRTDQENSHRSADRRSSDPAQAGPLSLPRRKPRASREFG